MSYGTIQVDPQSITAGSEQTITITGASTYRFFGLQMASPTVAASTTITVKDSNDNTVWDGVYLLGFKDNWVPAYPQETPYKHTGPIDGPVKITISGSTAVKANIYYGTD